MILQHGFNATSVDDICARAGVTKGSYFHYFKSKEDIAIAAIDAWIGLWRGILQEASLERIEDPLDRVNALFDTMERSYTVCPGGSGCILGSIGQELSRENDRIREAIHRNFGEWVAATGALLSDAQLQYGGDFDPIEVAWWMQSFVQGTLLIAKSHPDPEFISNNLKHCRRYVNGLFNNKEIRRK